MLMKVHENKHAHLIVIWMACTLTWYNALILPKLHIAIRPLSYGSEPKATKQGNLVARALVVLFVLNKWLDGGAYFCLA